MFAEKPNAIISCITITGAVITAPYFLVVSRTSTESKNIQAFPVHS